MAQRLLVVPQIGEVVLTKRRGSKNIRISVNSAGQIRVGMPYWTPYEAGILFVKKHKSWIQNQLSVHSPKILADGSRVGKIHRISIIRQQPRRGLAEIFVDSTSIAVKTTQDPGLPSIQKKILKACEQALKLEAESLLPRRLELISRRHQLPYRNIRIRKLTSRWGSCSSKKDINLSYFLVQLSWELIDYVILHELAHTIHQNHSRSFWSFMETKVPNVNGLRRQIRSHKPRVEPH